MSNWEYETYVATKAGPERKHLTVMRKPGVPSIVFKGPTEQAVQNKIDKFWDDAAQKAGNRAEGVVKAQATKALKSASGVPYGDGGAV